MPIYEFRCSDCNDVFDIKRSRDEAGEPMTCPKDGAEAIRIFGAAIIVPDSGGGDFDFGDMDMGGMDMGGMGGMDMGGMDMGGMGGMDMGGMDMGGMDF